MEYRLEGTSQVIWSNLSWQKHNLDQMAQHPVQLNLGSTQCWGIPHFPGEIIPVSDCSECKIVEQLCQGPSICGGQAATQMNSSSTTMGLCLCHPGFLVPTEKVKTEVKKVLRTSAFSAFLVINSPLLFNSRSVFSFPFLNFQKKNRYITCRNILKVQFFMQRNTRRM